MDQPDAPEHSFGLAAPSQAAPPDLTPPAPATPADSPGPQDATPLVPLPPGPTAATPFGAALAPVLLEICGGRLTDVRWFRTDWQRGGALTGYCRWTDDDGVAHDAVVKMPVPPAERRWLVRLSSDEVTPRVFAHGTSLGGYDLAWVVMEKLGFGPVGRKWGGGAIDLLAHAAAHFYASAAVVPVEGSPKVRDWPAILKRAREHATPRVVDHSQRWKKALRQAGRKLDGWLQTWNARPLTTWCHGDLHLGNAMTRTPAPDGPAVLFDLANVRVGHWVQDAVYLEHLYWAHPNRLHGHKPAKLIAHYMKDYGMSPGDGWPKLANIKRALLAMSAPAVMDAEGGRRQVNAALEVLERYV